MLLRFPGRPGPALTQAADALADPVSAALRPLRSVVAAAGLDPGRLTAYRAVPIGPGAPVEPTPGRGAVCGYLGEAPGEASLDDATVGRLRLGASRLQGTVCVELLEALMEIDGASPDAPATHHYVVETDVSPGGDGELNAWYDREHLPGLAAVPGTVRAARYRNLDGGPVYRACYWLATPDAYGSAPWLAVRATEWSTRVRPTFVGTHRTMFERLR